MNTWIIFLEAGVALCLLLIIVFATLPRKEKSSSDTDSSRKLHDN